MRTKRLLANQTLGNSVLAGALALILAACGGENTDADKGAGVPPAQDGSPDAPLGNGQWFISAANPYAVEAGATILASGGSAVDAAIATQAVLGLVEPQSSGFGGGAFLLHYDPVSGVMTNYDGREVAPASATPDRFLKENGEPMNYYDAVAGGLSIGVPGIVAMLGEAHQEHGVLPWAELLDPAHTLARDGFSVSPRLNKLLTRIPRLKQMSAAGAYFYNAEGAPRPVGYVLKNPDYAETLEGLMEGGPRAFYEGAIADKIIAAANSAPNPSGMTLEDLAAYKPVKREPVCGPYRRLTICSMGPPSSGGVTLLQILGLLDRFDLNAAGEGSVEALHLILEASRLAYADRAEFLADQDQSAAEGGLSIKQLIAILLNPAYISDRAQLIDLEKAAETVEAGEPSQFPLENGAQPGAFPDFGRDASPEPPSTSHFVIVDSKGTVVSMTTTVEFAFGSHQMAGGMILNNQLTDFSFLPERDGKPVANAVAAGKRPRSSMTPVIVFDEKGDVWGALGSPGGPAIIGYVAKTLIAMVDWGMSIQDAVDYPNVVIPRGSPLAETDTLDSQVKQALIAKGHQLVERDLTSGVHGFVVTADGLAGAADPRREGVWKTGRVEE